MTDVQPCRLVRLQDLFGDQGTNGFHSWLGTLQGRAALPSTAAGGTVSRIVPALQPGAGVVTTRGHVRWVVTEYGAVNLFGLSLRQRGDALISLAHPDFRAELRRELVETRHFALRGPGRYVTVKLL